jgi:hypothetical protein
MFTTLDLSLNQYHHVFFQVEPDTSNVLTTYMYDNAMNSLGTIDVSFGTQSIVSALTSFDQNGANPYAIGVDHTGSTKVNMDLAFWGMYTSALKDKQRQTLMKFTNQTMLEPHSQATIYMVTVENGKFYVDGVQQAYLLQNPGYYVFDQRHSNNANHPLLLSTTANGIHGGGTEYTTGVVKNGIPGSLNAYTLIQVTENTPDLFYYCANHSGMGGPFTQVDTVYYVKVVQNVLGEYVYALSTSASGPYYNQMDLSFNAGETYVFDQSDPSNDGYQIVFGLEPDASDNYIDGMTVMGTPGQAGAYTLMELPADFTGSLFYYHDTIPYMGYGPLVLSVDNNAAGYGDVVTFTVTNRTGVAETYTITGVVSADINGADLSGSIGYGQQVDLSYAITGSDKTMVFSVGDLSANVNILINYEFAVQTNILGDLVFAVYDVSDSVYYNQPDLSFSTPNMYQFDLSSSVVDGGYTLVFGTEVDNSGTVVEGGYVTRDTGKVILDLREYTGDALYYFEDSSAGMGYYVQYEVNATESLGTLEGEAANEHFGNQISLNADGSRIVVFSGSTKVKSFEYNNGSWTQLGVTMTISNSTVSMDASGNSISIANISSTTTAVSYVYDLSGTNQWQLRGGTTFATGSSEGSNHASKLSGNGEYFWSTGWTTSGNAFLDQYYYNGSSWITTRTSDNGTAPRTYHIDTNYDGSVCVGTASSTSGGQTLHDFFVFPPTGTAIIKPTDISGNAISANLDCTRVAMVSGDGQYVRVYDKGADWSTWTLVGSTVSVTDMSTIALSDDGLRFVVGNPKYDLANGTQDTGIIQVYELQDGAWTMLYEETGTATSDRVGRSVGISQFGAVIANGRYDANALTNLGSVDVFGLNDLPSSFDVTVSGGVFVLSGTSQRAVSFAAYEKYFFDQSDPTNAGQILVFGRTPDATTLFTEGVTIMGSAGQQGAYTQIDLSAGFTGNLYYYSDASAGMGMVAIPLSIPNGDLRLTSWGLWINNTTDTPNFTQPIFTSSNPFHHYYHAHLLYNALGSNAMKNENYVHDSYLGTSVTTTTNNGDISGAWFQFQYPMALPIKRIQANASYPDSPTGQTKSLTNNGWPEYIVVAGSNDGTNWTYLDEVFIDPYMPVDPDGKYGGRTYIYFGTMARGWEPKTVTNDGTWLYYRFIITRIYTGTNTTTNHSMRLAQFNVYTTD